MEDNILSRYKYIWCRTEHYWLLSVHDWTHEGDRVTVVPPPAQLCLVHILPRRLVAVLLTAEHPAQPLLQAGLVCAADGSGQSPQAPPFRPAVDGVVLLLEYQSVMTQPTPPLSYYRPGWCWELDQVRWTELTSDERLRLGGYTVCRTVSPK